MRRLSIFGLSLFAVASACAVDAGVPPPPAVPSCDGPAVLDALARAPSFAVVLTDYASTAIALLDADGQVLHERWVHSGTTAPGLVATLSGDVALPTREDGDGMLTLIDRFRTDVVTRFCVPGGQLYGQVRTHGETGATGFSSNPQDVVFLSSGEAWVTRYEPALDATAPESDRGNDLARLDMGSMTRTGERIDLSSFDAIVEIATADGPTSVHVYARPLRAVRVAGDRIVVGLDRLSLDFRASAEGVIAVVDPSDASIRSVTFPGLVSCGRVVPVPGSNALVLATCTGYSLPYDPVLTPQTSGLVVVDAGALDPRIVTELRVEDTALAGALSNAVALDETHALAVVTASDGIPDALVLVDLASGSVATVLSSSDAYALGMPAFSAATGLVLVPDAPAGVRRLTWDGSGLTELEPVAVGAGTGLVPRAIGALQ